jgi:hypothetical protein
MTEEEFNHVRKLFVRLCEGEVMQTAPVAADLSELAAWSNRIPERIGPSPVTKNCYDEKA